MHSQQKFEKKSGYMILVLIFFHLFLHSTLAAQVPNRPHDASNYQYDSNKAINPIAWQTPLEISKKELPWSALPKLFPGDTAIFYDEHGSTRELAMFWTCPDCPPREVMNDYRELWGDDAYSVFPNDVNRTRTNDYFDAPCGNGYCRWLTFCTMQCCDYLIGGRFTGGFLGFAVFFDDGTKWTLLAFTPAYGEYGAYGECHDTEFIRPGSNTSLAVIRNHNGGAGSIYTTQMSVVGLLQGEFKTVLHNGFISWGNDPFGNWETEIVCPDSAHPDYGKIELITKGSFYHRTYFSNDKNVSFFDSAEYDWALKDAPMTMKEKIKEAAENKFDFSFELKRTFVFQGNQYVPIGDELKTERNGK